MASISPICKKCIIFISALKSPTYIDFMIKKSLKSKTSKSHTWAPLNIIGYVGRSVVRMYIWTYSTYIGNRCPLFRVLLLPPGTHVDSTCCPKRVHAEDCTFFLGGGGSTDNFKFCMVDLKVPSHQIRLCLKCYGWIGLDEYKDRGW